MSTRRALVLIAALLAAVMANGASASASPGAGWELVAKSYPTNFWHGVDEVQEVTASAGSGTFTLSFEGVETKAVPVHAAAAEVQAALEELASVGGANIAVTSSTPGEYRVEFTKALGNMRVATMSATGASVSVAVEGLASGTIGIEPFNVGAAESAGVVTVTDTLPAGLKAKQAGRLATPGFFGENFGVVPLFAAGVWSCSGNGSGPAPHVAGATVVTCTTEDHLAGGGGTPNFSIGEEELRGNRQPVIGIAVEAEQSAPEGTKQGIDGNHVSIVGGGAREAAATIDPVTISAEPPTGGLVEADAWFSNADGTIDRTAGSHPYAATFVFSTATADKANHEGYIAGSEIRNLETDVPPGLVGDLHNITQCTRTQLFASACPASSMVGRLVSGNFITEAIEQVFNMVPSPGVPAELGFNYAGVPVYIPFSVKTGSDNAVVARVKDIPQKGVYESTLVLWGVPADASHDRWRAGGAGCGAGAGEDEMNGAPMNGVHPNYCRLVPKAVQTPILRLPTACGEPQPIAFRELNGWAEPNAKSEVPFLTHDATGTPAGFTGCESLTIEPAFTAAAETANTDSPSGLLVEVSPSLTAFGLPEGIGPADLKGATVTLPEGFVINPGQAAGLQACPDGRPSPGHYGNALTTPEEATEGKEDAEAASCPPASKVGTVVIKSPPVEADAEKEFEGDVYILPSNPPEVKILVAASADGVNIKLVGDVHLDRQTGRVETTFKETPQLPFSVFKLSFAGGPRAALATPVRCGSYVTQADFTPWSAPLGSDFSANAGFGLTEGPGGGACPSSPLPFAPSFTAGMSSGEAGGFGTFTTLLQRGDGQQRVESFKFTSPAGLSGLISNVSQCPEPQASQGTCASAAQIGHAIVTSGPGANPLTIPQPGQPEAPIYLTGPYKGAPFGLSIVTPVKAGPFDLGTIVTRAKIEVDPTTAQVTVVTDPLPPIIKGVPTDLRSIYAVIDRSGFFFNPTSCEASQFTGSAQGTAPPGQSEPSQTASLSSHFAVGGCRGLTFAPNFAASTQGNGQFNHNGASLNVKIATNQGPQASAATPTEANIKKVEVALPVQLPSRLTTLQKACTEKQFAVNPAGCPAESNVGTATARTPVLPVPLSGPAYLVSHGNAAFPDLEFILQGDGVTIVLVGHTDIKKGVTHSRFETVPDAPISSFELNLPEGKFSALGTNGTNLCTPTKTLKRKKRVAVRRHGRTIHVTKTVTEHVPAALEMPTTITAQNGAVVNQTTKVAVTSCAKSKPAKAKKKAHKPAKRRKR